MVTGTGIELTNSAGWVRQVRALETVADVVTNSASSYAVRFFALTNLLPKSGGFFHFTNSPFRTATIELVGANTNHVPLTDSDDPVTSDFYWETNGLAQSPGRPPASHPNGDRRGRRFAPRSSPSGTPRASCSRRREGVAADP